LKYTNQPDQELLDRTSIVDVLRRVASATVCASSGPLTRAAHLDQLLRRCETELEQHWLRFLKQRNCRLPSHAQSRIEECNTRPDFLYKNLYCAVSVDRPQHEFPKRACRDRQQKSCLLERGWTVLRLGHSDDWLAIIHKHWDILGAEA